jgi:exosortase/archaeosortase family protein
MPARGASALAVRDPLVRFFLLAAAIYLGWYLLYAFVVQPWGVLDNALIGSLITWAGWILEAFGHVLLPETPNVENIRTIGVQGGHLLWIGVPCNGLSVFAVYSTFLLAYPGPWRRKLWAIPLGILSIHLINALRVVALCIVVTIDYEWLTFNHDYLFYVIVYGWVVFLWYLWVVRFSRDTALPA